MQNQNTIPLSLYIHFPWCKSRCHYCDFNAHQQPQIIPEKEYLNALNFQLEAVKNLQLKINDKRKKLESLFFGGGTPSLVSADLIKQTINQIAKVYDIEKSEITLEANPESLTKDKLKIYQNAGINRISLGVQSFNSQLLQDLSRAHNSQVAKKAINNTQEYFDNFNVDLMYGLMGQNEQMALDDLQTLLSFAPTHISYYELTIEANTYFYHHPPTIPNEKNVIKMQKNAIKLMKENGFKRYEVSAYAKNKLQSVHNLNYWEFGDYLAIGAGGAAKISFWDKNSQLNYFRYTAPKNPNQFISWANGLQSGLSKLNIQQSNSKERLFEFFLNTSRLIDGFEANLLAQRLNIKLIEIKKPIQKLVELELLYPIINFENSNSLIKPTKRGINFLNEIPKMFLNL